LESAMVGSGALPDMGAGSQQHADFFKQFGLPDITINDASLAMPSMAADNFEALLKGCLI